MTPISSDPQKRAIQIGQLKRGTSHPGNRSALKHGAMARIAARDLDAKTREIMAALAADAPVRTAENELPAADAVAVRMLADALIRLERIGNYLDRRGWEGEDGKPRPVLEHDTRLRGHVLDLLKELGMTPAARAKLGLDLVRGLSHAEKLDAHIAEHYGDGNGDVVDGTAT